MTKVRYEDYTPRDPEGVERLRSAARGKGSPPVRRRAASLRSSRYLRLDETAVATERQRCRAISEGLLIADHPELPLRSSRYLRWVGAAGRRWRCACGVFRRVHEDCAACGTCYQPGAPFLRPEGDAALVARYAAGEGPQALADELGVSLGAVKRRVYLRRP